MIDKIRIQNFKCLRDVEVELGPLNVLIGPNDSGKSSFLQAIGLFRVGGTGDINVADSVIWNRDNRLQPTLTVAAYSQTHEYGLPFMPSRGHHQPLREFALKLASSETYRLNPRLLRIDSQAQNETRLNTEGSNLAAVLHAMLIGADRQTFFEVEKKLRSEIPTLKAVSTPVAAPGTHRIEFSLNVDVTPAVTIPSGEASDGAMLLLAFLVIAHGNAPDLVMVEEPENGLHPLRLKMVIDLLRKISKGEIGSKPRQVIITTHSPLLLNFVDPSEVRIFRRDSEMGTEIKAMDKLPNIERLSKDFAPGELWYLYGEEDLVKGQTA